MTGDWIASGRPRVTLRPPAVRTVRPRVNLLDLSADAVADALHTPLFHHPRRVLRTHLSREFRLGNGGISKRSAFVDRVREWLLAIHVLVLVECHHGDDGVHVVRRGDRDRIDLITH